MTFENKEETVKYIQKLLDNSIDIDYYRLRFILDTNGIVIDDIIFTEQRGRADLSLVSIEDIGESSVSITVNSKSWNKFLPSIYQDNDLLKNFLFSIQVSSLTQREQIDNVEKLFNPESTAFVDWLSSWFGIKYHDIVDDDAKRVMLYNMMDLYKCRGTKKYFIKLIKILTNVDIDIEEYVLYSGYQYHKMNKQMKNSFKVIIKDKISDDKAKEKEKLRIIMNIIDNEKPVNTNGDIEYKYFNSSVEVEQTDYDEVIVDYHSELKSDDIYDY
ncbi:MAG: phage tail protein [Campylobacterota bacterium]|nr:phage tail protein [Campylobacterota bacterium]